MKKKKQQRIEAERQRTARCPHVVRIWVELLDALAGAGRAAEALADAIAGLPDEHRALFDSNLKSIGRDARHVAWSLDQFAGIFASCLPFEASDARFEANIARKDAPTASQ